MEPTQPLNHHSDLRGLRKSRVQDQIEAEYREAEELELKLAPGKPLFEPETRRAIVLESYDILATVRPNPALERLGDMVGFYDIGDINQYRSAAYLARSRGARSLFEMESALTGEMTFGHLPTAYNTDLVRRSIIDSCDHQSGGKKGRYHAELLRSFPECAQLATLEATCAEFGRSARPKDLTLFYLRTHGEFGSTFIGNTLVPIPDLLNLLDSIPGKKILLLLSCFSGSWLESLKRRQHASDYGIICASRAEGKSTNWFDDRVHREITRAIRARALLSEIVLPHDEENRDADQGVGLPLVRSEFDVRL